MIKLRYLILILVIFGFGITPVGAICNYEEQARLNKEVANVKVNYEIVEKDLPEGSCTPIESTEGLEPSVDIRTCYAEFIRINLLNLSENFTVEITDDYYRNQISYDYYDTNNGAISFFLTDRNGNEIQYNSNVTNFTIRILASGETGCEGSTLRTLYLQVPRYNLYSKLDLCSELSDYYLCQRYVTYDQVSYDSFSEQIRNELAEREEHEEEELKWYQKVWEFVVEHKTVFIAGGIIIVVAAGGVTAYIIIRRRRDII